MKVHGIDRAANIFISIPLSTISGKPSEIAIDFDYSQERPFAAFIWSMKSVAAMNSPDSCLMGGMLDSYRRDRLFLST